MKPVLSLALLLVALPVRAQDPGFAARPIAAAVVEHDPHVMRALHELGRVYLDAVEAEPRVADGLALLDSLRAAWHPAPPSTLHARLLAYEGALVVLRAKHAFWPHQKLSHVRSGLARLDRAVEAAPNTAAIRYLRLVSGFYLPGLFGRGDEVRADFAALARLLPHAAADFPGEMHAEVARFVLEHGDPPADLRPRLRATAEGSRE